MKIILEKDDPCPICKEPLKERTLDNEDMDIILTCPFDRNHYERYLGCWDDVNE